MSDITARILRVTEDLQVLQTELDEATRKASTQRQAVVDELVEGDLLDDLKHAVDNVRHFLWAYIEATSENPADLRTTMQGYRMQRVTEMLRMLKEEPELAQSHQAHSFFQEINNIANTTVDRYKDESDAKGGDPAVAPGKK
ncbi:MAG: hypothetical protein M3P27_05710 [Acidobacteriota bacterium]|nr:hypothetical protein [Acidobacteriota bacterium]